MQNIHAVLYTKPDCMPCKMTKMLLGKKGLPYVDTYYGNDKETNSIEVDSKDNAKQDWSKRKVEKLKDKYNIMSLPFIKIIDNDTQEILDTWTGFNPNKIDYWVSNK